ACRRRRRSWRTTPDRRSGRPGRRLSSTHSVPRVGLVVEDDDPRAERSRPMPFANINGVRIRYEDTGTSRPSLALVHGSWTSHHNWDLVSPGLAESFRVVRYDRRGHSESERPRGQGSIHEDVADLAALIEHLGLAPAYVVGNSWGSIITLRLAISRPELVRAIACHAPPRVELIARDRVVGPVSAQTMAP